MELSDEIHEKVKAACSNGDLLVDQGQIAAGLAQYDLAWRLLPPPPEQWEAATWIATAKGDALFRTRDYAAALDQLALALRCPDGLGNPFIHLRLGEALYELGDQRQALDNLARAYMAAGREIFAQEPKKYFEALKRVMRPPPGQDSL